MDEPDTRLVVTSRNIDSARRLAADLHLAHPGCEVSAISLDQNAVDFETRLFKLSPFLVIHTAGPYQGQDYRVARACINCNSHYIDLADGRAFVEGFSELDKEAKCCDLLLVCGASTLPGLSSAVVEVLQTDFRHLDHIEVSIAPAQQTPRGRGTVASVLSYCGKPFKVLEDGCWVTRYGWQNLRMQSYPGLGRRLSSACDVPDLALLPAWIGSVRTVTFHAALEAWWEQLALWLMAGVSRMGLIRNWARYAERFEQLGKSLQNRGSSTGGMHIRVRGRSQKGGVIEKTWHLTARDNHGPEIPCTPALVLAKKLVRDRIEVRGAMPCLGLMSLAEFDVEVSSLSIEWCVVE